MSSRLHNANTGKNSSAGNETSLSIEETNALRASLGLGPLKVSEPDARVGEKKREITVDTDTHDAALEGLKARVEKARKSREERQATLGDPGDDVNDEDILAWVQRNKTSQPSHQRSTKRQKVLETIEDGDGELLKNAKVKGHSLEALDADGEMILTLADKGILDASGNEILEEDEVLLENVRERENMEREQAIKASKKAKPLWEEDGRKRSMLDKYDEEEEEAFVLGDIQAGRLGKSSAGAHEMKDKLTAAKTSLLAQLNSIGGDYFTSEELEKMKKPKKKKQRKLKKKALTAEDIDDLEMAAVETAHEHLVSRHDRQERMQQSMENELLDMAEKRLKFNNALEKANVASNNLRNDSPGFDEDDGDELAASLAKARSIALKKRQGNELENLAKETLRRREKQEEDMKHRIKSENGSLTFTDIGEFARSIGGQTHLDSIPIKQEDREANAIKIEDDQNMIADEEEMERKPARKYRIHKDVREDIQPSAEAEVTEAIPHETTIGQGLGGVLSYLKERGELHKPVEWAGRTNDSRNAFFTGAMGGYQDVYTSGRSEDEIAANVEVALTRKDEYGRVLTPKEAFRQFCHNFHGIQPSQGSKEKRMRQAAKELAQKKAATGSVESGVVGNLKALQQKRSTPYMVLSGTVKPGQTRDATGDT